jgi:hypothetical protein
MSLALLNVACCKEVIVTTRVHFRFFESLPDEGLLALASHRFAELPEDLRRDAQCNVIVRRSKPHGARAVHHIEVDFERGPSASRVVAACSDPDPYAALSRAFDCARASLTAPPAPASFG